MAENMTQESLVEQIQEQIHEYTGDSSSSSDDEKAMNSMPVAKKQHLFGRQEPLHAVLGGGKSADIVLWRNRQTSASIVASGTVVWLLFEWMGYHLLTLLCHFLMFTLAVLFFWSYTSSFLNKPIPKLPEVILPEEMFLDMARTVQYEVNEAFTTFRSVASGRDVRKFLMVLSGLWVVSVISSWFNFLTLFYIVFVILYTVPVLYEKYEDHVDAAGEKALIEVNKHYEAFEAKVLQKIPKGCFPCKKQE